MYGSEKVKYRPREICYDLPSKNKNVCYTATLSVSSLGIGL